MVPVQRAGLNASCERRYARVHTRSRITIPAGTCLFHPPGRALRPTAQCCCRPCGGLVSMTRSAWIGDFVFARHVRGDELKRMGMHKCPRSSLRFDLWHVAGDTLAAWRAGLMVCVLLKGGGVGTVRRQGAVAVQAYPIGGLSQLCIVRRPVNIVTTGAGDVVPVHDALHKVVALHAVFMGRTIWEIVEGLLAQRVILQFPEVIQLQANLIADRPVVILALNWIRQGLSLRVALDAVVVGCDIVHVRGIQDVAARRMGDMFASRPMAALATHIPFGHGVRFYVVVDCVTAVTGWPCWTVHVVGRIVRRPPVFAHQIWHPLLMRDVPLCGQRIMLTADLGEIVLFPDAAVDKCDLRRLEIYKGWCVGK